MCTIHIHPGGFSISSVNFHRENFFLLQHRQLFYFKRINRSIDEIEELHYYCP